MLTTRARYCRLQRNLWNFNKIARDNGGNRAFGLPGYKASLDYVLERAQKRYGKQMDTFVQPFNHTFQQTRDIWLKGPDGQNVFVITLMFNHPTPVPGGYTANLVDTPVDDTRGKQPRNGAKPPSPDIPLINPSRFRMLRRSVGRHRRSRKDTARQTWCLRHRRQAQTCKGPRRSCSGTI